MPLADRELTVIGYQASGKTTFAAALWYLVDSGEVNDTALVKGKHNGDFVYLDQIADIWAEGYAVERTKHNEFRPIRINLNHTKSDTSLDLSFVDLSGETFERLFATRVLDERVDPFFRRATGVLLFVSALHIRDDISLLTIGMAMPDDQSSELGDEEIDKTVTATLSATPNTVDSSREQKSETIPNEAVRINAEPPADEFRPEKTPQQVQLVDLLDALSDAPVGMRPARICVVISAWDKAGIGQSPEEWLEKRMPLLHQYLQTHDDLFEKRVYGVSAQGGHVTTRDLENEPSDRKKLLQEKVASHRIKVRGHGAGPHDLTHPVAWLSGFDT